MEYFLMSTTVVAWIGCLLAICVLRNGRYPALRGMRVLIWLYSALVTLIVLLDLVNEWRALTRQADTEKQARLAIQFQATLDRIESQGKRR